MTLKTSLIRWFAVALAVLVLLLGAYAERLTDERQAIALRADVQRRLAEIRERLSGNLYADLQLVRGLVGVIHLEPQLSQARFERAVRPLMEGRTQLRNVAAAPDMVVQLMFPLRGNERAIGLDYRKTPAQAEAAERARATRQVVLAGPLNLVQGGVGLIARVPVYLTDTDGAESFWGLVSAVIDAELLYERSGLRDASAPIEIAIRGRDATGGAGSVFFGRAELFDKHPVLAEIELPQGSWQLAAAPRAGWAVTGDHVWPLRLGFGLIALAVLGAFYAQGRAVQASALAAERAESAKRQVSSLLEAAPDAMLLIDRDGRIVQANSRAVQMFGHPREALLALTLEQLVPAASAAAPAPGDHTSPRESLALCRDGARLPVEITLGPLQTDEGLFVSAALRDITARRRADDELKLYREHLERLVDDRTRQLTRAKEAAEAANVAKSSFLANMSHEIRTPLNAITGMVHLMRRDALSREQTLRLDTVESASSHLLEVINSILDLSKIDSGKFELMRLPVRPDQIVANVMSMMAARAQAKGLALQAEVAPIDTPLLGDPTRLQQCLLNYVANAVKFTERGQVTIRVQARPAPGHRMQLRFEVEDTGIGIDAVALQRLFMPFEQANNSSTREHGGTGLGLTITRRLALLMGGDANARSTPGRGSCFWFSASIEIGSAERAETSPAPLGRVEESTATAFRGCSVLLVEDDPVNQLIAQTLLEDAGLEVVRASHGEQAVELASAHSFDLILMDIQMPRMDGLEATRRIRTLPAHRRTPIVALSANVFVEDRRSAVDAGMNDFLAKPFDPAALRATLRKWVVRSRAPGTVNRA